MEDTLQAVSGAVAAGSLGGRSGCLRKKPESRTREIPQVAAPHASEVRGGPTYSDASHKSYGQLRLSGSRRSHADSLQNYGGLYEGWTEIRVRGKGVGACRRQAFNAVVKLLVLAHPINSVAA